MPNQIQQVLIVLCVLAALPLACRILDVYKRQEVRLFIDPTGLRVQVTENYGVIDRNLRPDGIAPVSYTHLDLAAVYK